uniref:Ig-like domain-containing protein n=1 Tax=Neolamprologus brichardi TaxID=32507 RepID=A0A3Q4I5T5_NEOBR
HLNLLITQIFLLLIKCVSRVVGPSEPVVAIVGDDTVLPCHLDPAVNAADMTVEWTRSDLTPRFVHVWRDGVELVNKKNVAYMERTSLPINNLKLGDISLKLSKVKLSDRGSYKCFISVEDYANASFIRLGKPAFISSPVIELTNVKNEMVLECKSNGWYPEPQMLWVDSEEKPISVEPTKNVRGSDGLYTVSSKVTVEKGQSYKSRTFCLLIFTGDLFMVQSNTAVHIIVNLAVCLISFVTVVILIWKCGQKKTSKFKLHSTFYPNQIIIRPF